MPTVGEVLADAKARLRAISISASLDAQVLLAEILSCDRAHLIAYPEKELSAEQAERYENWLKRREQGEPVAYILGRRAFYDLEFVVTPAVLIPRPETEHLLELALAFAKTHPRLSAVDVGTGSGALAVSFARHVSSATVYASDISPDALAVAQQNAERNQVHVTWMQGDLLAPLIQAGVVVSLVMANLPYIATDEMYGLEVSRYEPHLALDGGPDGLDLVRRLLEQVPACCTADACILLEIGADQGAATCRLAQELLPGCKVQVHQDYAGLDRIVQIDL